jgi:hypothetical protein
VADLLNIWEVSPLTTKYTNPYALGANGDKKIPTFEALAEKWQAPELKQWHSKLGDFWGPIVRGLKRETRWLALEEI